MTPVFGFWVGDFISGINLVRKIIKALKKTDGASSEYQAAVVELKGLKHALQHLQALEPTEDNLSHVNAIRGMALACQLPLRDFMTKLEKYESSLGPWADRTGYRGAGRKARWAVGFGAEVEKLRALVAAKQISINLLLATHASQTISSINERTKREHGTLISKITEQRARLHQLHDSIERVEKKMEGVESSSRAIISKVDETQTSVMSLRSLGEQIMAFIRTFPHDMRDLLQNIMQADWRTYQAVLQIQERLARSPTSLHDSNIQFTNVLGEYRELPYEYFCQWEPFEGFLRAQFKNKPGEGKILEGQFYIVNAKNRSEIIRKEHWSRSISQGTKLTMSMIMSHLQRNLGSCPRPDCRGMGIVSDCNTCVSTCTTCHLCFYSKPRDLDDAFGRSKISEDDIVRQQINEDLRLYGIRPEPPDAIEVNECIQLANLPPKRNASEFAATVDDLAKAREKGKSKEFNYETLTVMDWNSGASPLDAWLNQSAVPSTTTALKQQECMKPESDILAQEVEEIKVFRNVHMTTAPSPERNDPLDCIEALDFGAEIYYRNIMDRYPAIPIYLARRLAQANHDRAERLRNKKRESMVNTDLIRTFTNGTSANNVAGGTTHQLMTPETHRNPVRAPVASQNKNEAPFGSTDQPPSFILTPLNRPCPFSTTAQMESRSPASDKAKGPSYRMKTIDAEQGSIQIPVESTDHSRECRNQRGREDAETLDKLDRQIQALREVKDAYIVKDGYNSLERSPTIPPVVDFWTGGSQSSRPPSAYSRSSSMNSSLQGRPAFDPQEQNPTFAGKYPASTAYNTPGSPTLPPPPVELGKVTTFNCDICGQVIQAKRRLEWQQHVMNDLQPYVCTFLNCSQAGETYVSRSAFLEHELSVHGENDSNLENRKPSLHKKCVFCGEVLPEGEREERSRHVGRHMEVIAFTVVAKSYGDWDLYSDGSSARYSDTDMPCNTIPSPIQDLRKYGDTTYKIRRQKVRSHLCTDIKTFSNGSTLTRHMRVVQ